jgi:hypothetical protein
MTITTKTSAKGTTFTADGYNTFYKAFEQGAVQFTVFVPAATVEKMGLTAETIHGFVSDVQAERVQAECGGTLANFARGVRILSIGRVQ